MPKIKKPLKIIKIALCGISMLFGLLPIIYGYSHVGNIVLLAYGLLMLAIILLKTDNFAVKFLNLLVAALTLVGVGFLTVILQTAYFNVYDGDEPATVVVMGCMVRDGNPSLMLTERLNVAYDVLSENPDYPCVVSGGLTPGEPMSEAEVMYNYLVDLGIDPERIYLEDKSTGTQENIAFTSEIISASNLPETLIIATDGFHQYRSVYYAEQSGHAAYSTSSLSAFGLVPGYYVREMLAILEIIVN